MNDAQWATSVDPEPMLNSLRGHISERKLRLFACACCRDIWHLLTDQRCRKAVEIAELFADGKVGPRELGVAHGDAWRVLARNNSRKLEEAAVQATREDAYQAAVDTSVWAAWAMWKVAGARDPGVNWDPFRPATARGPCPVPAVRARQAMILRDLVRVDRSVGIDVAWLKWEGGTVVRVARTIYEDHDFGKLSILADALEDAGCVEAELLDHLRGGGPHARGCWALDLLLGWR